MCWQGWDEDKKGGGISVIRSIVYEYDYQGLNNQKKLESNKNQRKK